MDDTAKVWIPGAELAGLGGVYVRGDDQIRVTSFNAAAGVTLAIEGRFLGADGYPQIFGERHVPNTDRSAASSTFSIGEGFLLNLMVRASGGSPRRGQCFVLLELVRGRGATVAPMMCLLQGYATDTSRLFWPGSAGADSGSGPGFIRSIVGTDPAAGAEISETVPTNARWRLIAFTAVLVSDATVAARQPVVTFDDGANVFYRAGSNATQAASLSGRWTAAAVGSMGATTGADQNIPTPDTLMLPGGARIRTSTTNLQAGDNWGAPMLHVEEWIED